MNIGSIIRLRYVLLVCSIVLCFFESKAQEIPVYSSYYVNPFLYNPGYAGTMGGPVFSANYRRQWLNIAEGPSTSTFTFHAPLKFGLSTGLLAYNDTRSIISTNNILLTLGYSMKLGDNFLMSLGLSGGVLNNIIDLSTVDPANPGIPNLPVNNLTLDGRVGIWMILKNASLGVALPRIFDPNLVNTENFSDIQISPVDVFMAHLRYKHEIDLGRRNVLAIEPNALYYQPIQTTSPVAEGLLNIRFNNLISAGMGYRQYNGLIATAGLSYFWFEINYTYDAASSSIGGFNNSSHEIHIGFNFGDNPQKTKKKQVSSFIAQRAEAAAKLRQQQEEARLQRLEELRKQQQEQREQAEVQKREQERQDSIALLREEERIQAEKAAMEAKMRQEAERVQLREDSIARIQQIAKMEEEMRLAKQREDSIQQAQLQQQAMLDQQRQQELKAQQRQLALWEQQRQDSLNNIRRQQEEERRQQQIAEAERRKADSIAYAKELEAERLAARQRRNDSIANALRLATQAIEEESTTPEPKKTTRQEATVIRNQFGGNKPEEEPAPAAPEPAIEESKQPDPSPVKEQKPKLTGYEDSDFIKLDPVSVIYPEKEKTFSNIDVEETEKIDKESVNQAETTIMSEDDFNSIHTTRPKDVSGETTVSMGSHYMELEKGAYVIVGVFSSVENAENYSDQLFDDGLFTKYGFNSEKGLFYVYIYESMNPEAARKERDRKRDSEEFQNAWVLIVE